VSLFELDVPDCRQYGTVSAPAVASLLTADVASHPVVSRKIPQIVVLICLVAFALAYPLIESQDHWDAPGPASDSELQVIGVLTFAGAMFLLTQMLVALPVSIATQPRTGLCLHALWKKHILFFSPDLTASPPVALRI